MDTEGHGAMTAIHDATDDMYGLVAAHHSTQASFDFTSEACCTCGHELLACLLASFQAAWQISSAQITW